MKPLRLQTTIVSLNSRFNDLISFIFGDFADLLLLQSGEDDVYAYADIELA